jgi:hypothetical protein
MSTLGVVAVRSTGATVAVEVAECELHVLLEHPDAAIRQRMTGMSS